MSDISINYKGSAIATMDASGTKTLGTEGKYCEDDIEVVYTKPAGPTGTKSISITENGTTTEDVTNYASAEITVDVQGGGGGGLTLLGSGTYVKESDSASISIPVSYTGTPKEYFYYNTTPPANTQQTIMGYNRVLDNNDLADYLPNGNLICAHRTRNASNAYAWSASTQVITLTSTTMSCGRPGVGVTHVAGTWKWFIYGEAAT